MICKNLFYCKADIILCIPLSVMLLFEISKRYNDGIFALSKRAIYNAPSSPSTVSLRFNTRKPGHTFSIL